MNLPLPPSPHTEKKPKTKKIKKSSQPPPELHVAPPPETSPQPADATVALVPPVASSKAGHPPGQPPKGKRRILISLLRVAAAALRPSVFQTLAVLLVAVFAWWYLRSLASSLARLLYRFASLKPNLPSFPGWPSRIAVTNAVTPLVSIYCTTIGVGCRKNERVGGVARTVKIQAVQAMDLFESVLELGGSQGVGTSLHHVALWELAVTIKHTSGLESRDFLGSELMELGDMTRDVKDEITRLNSEGLNSFTWIAHEFSRIEELIQRAHTDRSGRSQANLDHLLDSLLQKISSDLTSLLRALDRALPLADRASSLGGRLSGALASEYARTRQETESIPIWRRLVDQQGFKGKQLRRDLELSKESIEWVKDVRLGLEQARTAFLEYSSNVGHFKAGMVGYHLSGHGLSAEEEVASLRSVMANFRRTVDEVKRSSRSGIPKQKSIDEVASAV